MLGFIILLGSVVNNPILIVEQSLNFIEQGLERHEAIVEATLSRVRPILMTTGTTVLGLMPLVVLPGAGSELYRGLGVVMFGGLVVGTVTTTVFMPCVLSLTMDFSEWVSGLLPRESISRVVPLYEDEKEED
jgi:HAE1 family hydrophobic/amphiphilic exporter-1